MDDWLSVNLRVNLGSNWLTPGTNEVTELLGLRYTSL